MRGVTHTHKIFFFSSMNYSIDITSRHRVRSVAVIQKFNMKVIAIIVGAVATVGGSFVELGVLLPKFKVEVAALREKNGTPDQYNDLVEEYKVRRVEAKEFLEPRLPELKADAEALRNRMMDYTNQIVSLNAKVDNMKQFIQELENELAMISRKYYAKAQVVDMYIDELTDLAELEQKLNMPWNEVQTESS